MASLDILLSVQQIPLSLAMIGSAEHPVKVGLSDAFMVTSSTSQSPDGAQQTIYEYHRVEIDMTKISNSSAVELTPLPTCLLYDSCELCLSSNQSFGCSWCNVLQRCSDGMDRHRQEWLDYSCSEESKDATCDDYFRDDGFTGSSVAPQTEDITPLTPGQRGKGLSHTGIIAGIAAALVLLLALILVALCIHCYPTGSSRLYLIQRRKSYWPSMKFQNQQPGYTEVEGDGHEKYSIVEAGPC
uniref:Plexin domain-containing protein 1-like n=1 Tax=Fundulus heteroclitus TaxID=8078 RepID=A0A3Q2PD48_FUNHE